MENILKAHFERYPLMQATDIAKLIYQSAFGPGHLIKSREYAAARLSEELKTAEPGVETLEDIGSDLCRLYIRNAVDCGMTEDELLDRFIETANTFPKDEALFHTGMETARRLFPRFADELERLETECRESGYAPFSHSEVYRNAYHPAYRVVTKGEIK